MPTPKELLACIPGGRILDVATGNGNFVSFLLEGLPAFDEIVGIDTSEKAGTAFNETFKDQPHVRFEKMDAAKMDFPKASFDIVCISNSLHHMSDPEPVLDEMKRVLKPGGHFFVAEMYPMLNSFSAFQDFDGIYHFDTGFPYNSGKINGFFQTSGHPLKQVFMLLGNVSRIAISHRTRHSHDGGDGALEFMGDKP